MSKSATLSCRISPSVKKALEEEAAASDESMSRYVQAALINHFPEPVRQRVSEEIRNARRRRKDAGG